MAGVAWICYHIVVLQTGSNEYRIVLAKKFNVPDESVFVNMLMEKKF